MARGGRTAAAFLVALLGVGGCAGQTDEPSAAGSPTPRSPTAAVSPTIEQRDDLLEVFEAAGVVGTFAVLDASTNAMTVVDRARAEQRLVPASTFKIPHALIALETSAIASLDEIVPYDGAAVPFPEWERDMSVREAIKVSNAALFQQLARRIGPEREREWVRRLGYGNAQIGEKVDQFWLDGPLEISASEQVQFLRRVARRALPASASAQDAVVAALEVERTPRYAMYGKTGWQFSRTPQVGWWVGWVEHTDARVHTFALNIDITRPEDAALRVPLARRLLERLAVLPASPSPTPGVS